MSCDVLVIIAHPDDETLGCGGTIARLTGEGKRVAVYAIGDGVTSRHLGADVRPAIAARWRQFVEACAVLGATADQTPLLHLWPDQLFDSRPLLGLTSRITAIIADERPRAIYTHSVADLNRDHRIIHEAVLVAARPQAGRPVVAQICAMEVPSSTEWGMTQFRPTLFVDVTATIERKVQALGQYAAEVRPFPHPRSKEGIYALATYRGMSVGVAYAEAFEIVRVIR